MHNTCITAPCVIVANHTSATNALVLLSTLRGRVVCLVARDWYEKPLWHSWMVQSESIPVDRFGVDTQWLRDCAQALHEGKSILIFPEGRVRKDGITDDFKPGFALLASFADVPVVPVTFCSRYTPLRHARLAMGLPLQPDRRKAMDSAYLQRFSQETREAVTANRALYPSLSYGATKAAMAHPVPSLKARDL